MEHKSIAVYTCHLTQLSRGSPECEEGDQHALPADSFPIVRKGTVQNRRFPQQRLSLGWITSDVWKERAGVSQLIGLQTSSNTG